MARLGRAIACGDARRGDFAQIWRNNGSGHSVVFLDWVREDGAIVGLRYWSTQPATDGIGERVERFDGERGVDREQIWLARVGDEDHAVRFAVAREAGDDALRALDACRLELRPPQTDMRRLLRVRGHPDVARMAVRRAERHRPCRIDGHGEPARHGLEAIASMRHEESHREWPRHELLVLEGRRRWCIRSALCFKGAVAPNTMAIACSNPFMTRASCS